MEVDAVLFDLDGVLVDSTASVERLWRTFAAEHGLDGDLLLEDLHGRRMVDIIAAALPHLDVDSLGEEARRIDATEADDAHATVPLPGALHLVDELRRRGVRWAIATSGTTAVATARLAAVGLAAPPVLVTAGDVAAGKPAPDPYLMAAARLEVDPARCLVIEDAPSGLLAGNAAGATTAAVTTSHRPADLLSADHLVRSVADVTAVAGSLTAAVELTCSRHPSPRSPELPPVHGSFGLDP